MSKLTGFWTRLQRAINRRAFDQQMAEEMREHLERESARRIAAGEDTVTARRRAAIEFGNAESFKEQVRDHRFGAWIEEVGRDVGFAMRLLRKSPGFAFAAVATLAIGIGANTAIFSAVDAVLFRPQPYPEPERLVNVFERVPNGGRNSVSGSSFINWRDHQTQFEALALYTNDQFDLTGRGDPEKINALSVSADFNRVLGLPPLLGRGFQPGDDQVGGQNNVVILTERFWRNRLAASPDAIGQNLMLDGSPFTIVGVMRDRAWVQPHVAIFVPYALWPQSYRVSHDVHRARVLGRLAPGATLASAEAELNAIKENLRDTYPTFKHTWGVALQPMQEVLGQEPRPVLLLLLGAVALVLLIACANVANLLLARASTRQREMALRAALGASSRRIVRQVITESLLLALMGGAVGVALATAGIKSLGGLSAGLLPATMAPQLDGRVLAFSLLASCGTGLLFGIFPAWRVRRPDLNHALKSGTGGTTDGGRTRSQSTLVIAEVALTAILLVGTGLLLRGMVQAVSADPGLNVKNVLMFDLTMPFSAKYQGEAPRMAFIGELISAMETVPGVTSVASAENLPFGGGSGQGYFISLEEKPETRQDYAGAVDYVSPGYFATLDGSLLRGRLFTDQDNRANAPRVAVINQALVDRFFGTEDPIGRRIRVGPDTWEVVGVTADMRVDGLHAPPGPTVFMPHWYFPWASSFLVRTAGEPLALTDDLAAAIHRLDPHLPLANVRTLESAVAASLGPHKLILNLIGAFAGTALLLASIGLYGVMAYAVVSRQRELSIRAALGAARADIMGLIVGRGVRLMAVGLVLGLAGAFGLARVMANRMPGVSALDPVVFTGAAVVLGLVALIACSLPAWRAARANPITALRND